MTFIKSLGTKFWSNLNSEITHIPKTNWLNNKKGEYERIFE